MPAYTADKLNPAQVRRREPFTCSWLLPRARTSPNVRLLQSLLVRPIIIGGQPIGSHDQAGRGRAHR